MKKLYLMAILSLVMNVATYAEGRFNVEMPIYITDVNDITDTIVLALHPQATLGVDTSLGEVALSGTELAAQLNSNQFAVTKIDRIYARWGSWNVWGRKAVVDDAHGEHNTFIIGIANHRFPVRVQWDSTIVASLLPESIITDWMWGCWWDCGGGYWPEIVYMATSSQASFDYHDLNAECPSEVSVYADFPQDICIGFIEVCLTDRPAVGDAINPVVCPSAAQKIIENGRCVILRNGAKYDLMGVRL